MCKKFLKNRKKLDHCSLKKEHKFLNSKIFSIVLVSLLVVSGLTYLWLVNNRSIMGYEIASLEKKVKILKNENKKLSLSLIDLQEVSHIKERAEQLQMVAVTEVDYLTITDDGLARR